MFTGSEKIRKEKPSELEKNVAQQLMLIQTSSKSIKAELKPLYFVAARELDVVNAHRQATGQKALVVFVPCAQLSYYRKIQRQLVSELEKKFTDTHVVIVAQRTVLPKNCNRDPRFKGPRPRSRTLTKVREAMLDDLVYPAEVGGKRTRVRMDGTKLLKVQLTSKDAATEDKLDTFSTVYSTLTDKNTVFNLAKGH